MRFTEHELTTALTGTAKEILAARRKDVRRGQADIDTVWAEMGRYERFKVLDALGEQLLPVLIALPDVEVAAGARPSFTHAQVVATVEACLGEGGPRLRRKAAVLARTALVRRALEHVPPRIDPDALLSPDAGSD